MGPSVQHPDRLRDNLRLVSEDLIGDRGLARQDIQQLVRILVFIPEPLGADHFGTDQGSAHFAADAAEGGIGDARKGRQNKGIF